MKTVDVDVKLYNDKIKDCMIFVFAIYLLFTIKVSFLLVNKSLHKCKGPIDHVNFYLINLINS